MDAVCGVTAASCSAHVVLFRQTKDARNSLELPIDSSPGIKSRRIAYGSHQPAWPIDERLLSHFSLQGTPCQSK